MPEYKRYPMVLNNVFLGMLDIRTDQQNYFNIPDPTPEELALSKYRTSGSNVTRNLHSDRLDSVTPTRQVTVNRTARTRERRKDRTGRGGRAIKIPTELKSTPPTQSSTDPGSTVIKRPTVRTTTILFPNGADLAEISAWLYLKLVAHKPSRFTTPSGTSYALAPFVGQPTGAGDTTP